VSTYRLTPDAEQDLDDIWLYIAADSSRNADLFEDRLFGTFDRLAAMPGIGHRRPDWTDKPVLFFPVGQYLIVYRETAPLEIVRVLHGARHMPRVLGNP